jgi:hypothetical protein
MKKILGFIALIFIAGSANAAVMYSNTGLSSADTTLTFDEVVLASGTSLTNQYASFGVTFSGAVYNPQQASFSPATFGNQIGNFSPYNYIPVVSPWSIFFDNVLFESAFGIATNRNITTVEALLNGTVVSSLSAITDYDGTDFFTITGLKFDQIRLSTSNDRSALVDNLQFSAVPEPSIIALRLDLVGNLQFSAVPEPSIIALFAAGLLGLGFARRRKA